MEREVSKLKEKNSKERKKVVRESKPIRSKIFSFERVYSRENTREKICATCLKEENFFTFQHENVASKSMGAEMFKLQSSRK